MVKIMFMDFRLRVFVEVANYLSFTKAANVLEISQPAISKHIQELEASFNVKLFKRTSGKISLTSAGQMLLYHAEAILQKYKELGDDMALVASLVNDHELCTMPDELRIGATVSSLQSVAVPMVGKLSALYPNLKIVLTVATEGELEEALASGNLDLVL